MKGSKNNLPMPFHLKLLPFDEPYIMKLATWAKSPLEYLYVSKYTDFAMLRSVLKSRKHPNPIRSNFVKSTLPLEQWLPCNQDWGYANQQPLGLFQGAPLLWLKEEQALVLISLKIFVASSTRVYIIERQKEACNSDVFGSKNPYSVLSYK
jgi:hypothetical protein